MRGQWIRSTRRTAGFALLWGAMAAFWGAIGLVPIVVVLVRDESPLGLAVGALLLAFAAALGVLARRSAQAGLLVCDRQLVVRGPFATLHMPLSSVERFAADLQDEGVGNPTPGVVVILADGSPVSVWALASEGLVWNSERNTHRWLPTANALNDLIGQKPQPSGDPSRR